ncbi:hypothetical protein [Clostridium butyricum]|mgnify:CR=1 FL=1|uniref:Uncharacterized protein n=1 Tax=Clostridium butyricum TaxID=1492 RepID=A0A6N3BHN7_CLOBU|nr:hypothetical protein [Clostridium butyricum]ALR90239.1 hypothetical protein ATN24_17405 [Clostridium butyricum]ALS19124.1 hypothetical protein ATD26_19860 [Clostridium butyricum]ANF16311.1 hypothetical protein AZ909_19895 [Clostridium butyricum]AOR96224.1 hypothetical protein BBB49_19365 [Clostridium butyricum]MCI3010230.1 hypothetical protein [Clostridium butyricum]
MDRSRKTLKDLECCGWCIHYQSIKEKGYKTSKGKCKITGTVKQRTDKCKKSFKDRRMKSFFD